MLFVKCVVGVAMRCYVKSWNLLNTAIHNIFCENTSIQIRVDFQIVKIKSCQRNTNHMRADIIISISNKAKVFILKFNDYNMRRNFSKK